MVHVLLKPGLENSEHYFTSMWDECNCAVVWAFFGIAFLRDWNENWPFPVLWPLLSFPNLLTYWVQHFHSITAPGIKMFNCGQENVGQCDMCLFQGWPSNFCCNSSHSCIAHQWPDSEFKNSGDSRVTGYRQPDPINAFEKATQAGTSGLGLVWTRKRPLLGWDWVLVVVFS